MKANKNRKKIEFTRIGRSYKKFYRMNNSKNLFMW